MINIHKAMAVKSEVKQEKFDDNGWHEFEKLSCDTYDTVDWAQLSHQNLNSFYFHIFIILLSYEG